RELENQILAATTNVDDILTLELGRDRVGRLGAGQPAVLDRDALEPPPGQAWSEPGADRLDLGKLWHGVSLGLHEAVVVPYGLTIGSPGSCRPGSRPPSHAFTVAPTSANW